MVARNGKSMMKLARLPILRPLLLKHEILWWFESSKNLKDLYGWMASKAIKFEKVKIGHPRDCKWASWEPIRNKNCCSYITLHKTLPAINQSAFS